jgi:hypothetical protein
MRPPQRRRPFVDLRSAEIQMPEVPRLFLGRFELAALRAELEQAGIVRGLAERGHADIAIQTEYQGGEHRLRVDSASGGPSLIDLRLAEGTTLADEPLLRRHGLEVISFLSIHWLSLQDPTRDFTPDRPRLPGQSHPGLGLSRPLVERVLQWAAQWGKDGLLNLPEYYHNAVFYAKAFSFILPVRQGRFEALRRDLSLLHVAKASSAVEQGRVIEEPWGAPLHWEPGEMIVPVSDHVRAYLDSPEYRTAVARARDGARFRLR